MTHHLRARIKVCTACRGPKFDSQDPHLKGSPAPGNPMTLTSVGTDTYVRIPAHKHIIKNYINFSKACTPENNWSGLPQRGGALGENSRASDSEL